jgi:transposase
MRYELTDYEWAAIKPFLPNKPRGVPRVNDRRVLNGILWALHSGAPWRDLPESFGPHTARPSISRPLMNHANPSSGIQKICPPLKICQSSARAWTQERAVTTEWMRVAKDEAGGREHGVRVTPRRIHRATSAPAAGPACDGPLGYPATPAMPPLITARTA